MRLVFFGTGIFPLKLLAQLNHLTKTKHLSQLTLATTLPKDKPKQQPKQTVLQYANENQISTLIIGNDKTTAWNEIKESPIQADVGLVCNFGLMIPSFVIDQFGQGMFVVHPSLLPKYRGASPIQRALMAGDTRTGVSFIEISKRTFDAGKIVHQSVTDIAPRDRYLELSDKLAKASADQIEYVLSNLEPLRAKAIDQDPTEVTKAPKIDPSEIVTDFNRHDAVSIYNQYRALYGTNQPLRSSFQGKVIFLEQMGLVGEKDLSELPSQAECGIIKTSNKKHIFVRCRDSWVRVERFRHADRSAVQPACELAAFREQNFSLQ